MLVTWWRNWRWYGTTIVRPGWCLSFGPWYCIGAPLWRLELLWSRMPPAVTLEGQVPFRRRLGASWEWFPRPRRRWFGSTVRRHLDGTWNATAWTGRDSEIIGWDWRATWWKS